MKKLIFLFILCLVGSVHAESSYWIDNVRIIDVAKLDISRPKAIFIKNGRIEAIKKHPKKGNVVIDAEGQYLIPGLIDAHVHLSDIPGYQGDPNTELAKQAQAQIPRSYLYYGFTTLVDVASAPSRTQAWNSAELAPTAYHCSPVPIASGYPLVWAGEEFQFSHPMAKHMLYEKHRHDIYPENFDLHKHSAEYIINAIAEEKALCVKTFFERGFGGKRNLAVPEVKAIQNLVELAHKKGLKVFLHGNSEESYRFALKTKVDTIVHGMWHSDSDAATQRELAKQLVQAGIKTQPTMQVIYGETELFKPDFFEENATRSAIPSALMTWYKSEAGQWMAKIIAKNVGLEDSDNPYQVANERYSKAFNNVNNMTRFIIEEGGQLNFGTDTPSGPIYTQFPGLNGHKEIHHLHRAGLTLEKLLPLLTIDNAQFLGLEEQIGSIEIGKRADLLLLSENPLKTIEAYDSIETVVVKGKLVKREVLDARR
jgi:imidazolonepropionase-like amidohydrolase